jgi:hypothetical protein
VVSPQAASVTAKALGPMPLRTDPVSSTACDRCPYADHAAVNVLEQGVQRRPVAPKAIGPRLYFAWAPETDVGRTPSTISYDEASDGRQGREVDGNWEELARLTWPIWRTFASASLSP